MCTRETIAPSPHATMPHPTIPVRETNDNAAIRAIDLSLPQQPECIVDAEQLLEVDLFQPETPYADPPQTHSSETDTTEPGPTETTTHVTATPLAPLVMLEEPSLTPRARRHYDSLMALCSHTCCKLEHGEELAISFSRRSKTERSEIVRCMLLATAARPGDMNNLILDPVSSSRKRAKRAHSPMEDEPLREERASVVYALAGKRMCRPAFAAVTQLSQPAIAEHLREVTSSLYFELVLDRSKERRLDKWGIQRTLLKVFLKKFGDDYGLESPIGRHNLHGEPAQILPVGTNRKH
eukprot:IDg2696t1